MMIRRRTKKEGRSRSRSEKKKKKRDTSGSRSRSPKKKDKKEKKDKHDDTSPRFDAPQASQLVSQMLGGDASGELAPDMDTEPKQGKITINFATKFAAPPRDDSETAAAQKMLRKSEVHASQMAAVGALLARASATKAPQADPMPAPPPELLAYGAAPPAPVPASEAAPIAGTTAPASDDEASEDNKDEPPTEGSAMDEGKDEAEDKEASSKAAAASNEEPAHPLGWKQYPPPREEPEPGLHPLYPKGYPPPPDAEIAPGVHPLYPRGYPPPPDADQPLSASLVAPGSAQPGLPPPPSDPNSPPLMLPPQYMYPPPPPDPNSPPLNQMIAAGMLLPQPPPPSDPNSPPMMPPPMMPPLGPPGAPAPGVAAGTSDSVHNFLNENRIDPRAAAALRAMPIDLQLKVLGEGPVTGTNASAVLTARIRKIESQAPKAPGAAQSGTLPAAMLPPGGIGPQPPPGTSPLMSMPTLAAPPGPPPLGLQLGMPPPPGYSLPGMPPLGFPAFPGMLQPGAPQGGFLLPPPGPPPAAAP